MLSKLLKVSSRKSSRVHVSDDPDAAFDLVGIVPDDKECRESSMQSRQRQVNSIIDSHQPLDREDTIEESAKQRSSGSQSAGSQLQRASTLNRLSTQMQSFFGAMKKQQMSESMDESTTDDEQTASASCEVPVNPMKTLLGTVSNNAFVSWTHVSKVIQAMEVIHDDIAMNSHDMNKVMLQQCIKLLKDSPYVLKSKTDSSLEHKSAKFYRTSETDEDGNMVTLKPTIGNSRRSSIQAINQLRQKMVEFNTLPYGTASNDVSTFVSNMVNLHMDSAFNIYSENNGVISNKGVNTANDENEAKTAHFDCPSDDTEINTSTVVSATDTQSKSRKHRRKSSGGKSFVIDIGISHEISSKIMQHLGKINSWNDFNIFEFFDAAGHMSLPILGIYILKEYNLISNMQFDESKLLNYFQSIQQVYNSEVPYHNEYHGGDVMVTCFQIVKSRNKSIFNSDSIQLQNFELFSLFIAAMVHDVGHNGFNNDFHIKTSTDLALLYNDVSVLENYHAATSWKLLGLKENDFFGNDLSQRNKIRKLWTDVILHTDMSRHGDIVQSLNDLHQKCNIEIQDTGAATVDSKIELSDAERSMLLRSIVHTADISNPAKKFDYMLEWTNRINNEFFRQGDKERELGFKVSPLCDRENANVEKSQIGFGTFVVMPLIQKMRPFFGILDQATEELTQNLDYWKQQLSALNVDRQ